MKTIDGKGLIFGRVASRIAKAVIEGEEVNLINAEEMVISGNPKEIVAKFHTRRLLQNKGTPEHSPRWSKVPHLLVKRMIRGMLPHKEARGRAAFRRLMVYSGNPKKLEAGERLEGAELKRGSRFIRVIDLCRMIGYSG